MAGTKGQAAAKGHSGGHGHGASLKDGGHKTHSSTGRGGMVGKKDHMRNPVNKAKAGRGQKKGKRMPKVRS